MNQYQDCVAEQQGRPNTTLAHRLCALLGLDPAEVRGLRVEVVAERGGDGRQEHGAGKVVVSVVTMELTRSGYPVSLTRNYELTLRDAAGSSAATTSSLLGLEIAEARELGAPNGPLTTVPRFAPPSTTTGT